MARRFQFTMRTLIGGVLIAGVLIGLVSIPVRFVWRWSAFRAASDAGDIIIEGFRYKRPAWHAPANWDAAVDTVYNAWGNVAFSPDYIDNKPLWPYVEQLRLIEQRATAENSEKQLRSIFDMLERLRPRSKTYIDGMRLMFDDCLKPRDAFPETSESPWPLPVVAASAS